MSVGERAGGAAAALQYWEAGPGHEAPDEDPRVAGNARLTSAVAVALTALLLAEGLNLLAGVRQNLGWHAYVGTALVPPVLVKLASVGLRFVRYYRSDPAWVQKGPPPIVLRLLGPLLVALTVVLLATGLVLVLAPSFAHDTMLQLHKLSFIGWGVCFAVHFLGHLRETAWLSRRDLTADGRARVRGAGARVGAVAASVVIGLVVGLLVLGPVHRYQPGFGGFDDHGSRGGPFGPP